MLPFAYYLLKITICSAILFGYYRFMLRNKAFHAYNRFYLLAIVVLSLTLPLLHINIFQQPEAPKTNVIKMLQFVNEGDQYMDAVVIAPSQSRIFHPQDILPVVYAAVCLVFFILLVQMLIRIFSLARHNRSTAIGDIHIINTDGAKGTPFSFFRYIFWNDRIDMHSVSGKSIFKHELAHIQEKHSWDKMFINIVLIIFWCNPFFWLIRRELNMIHEFIADRRAVEDGDTAAFAAMILAATYPQQQFYITNPFFYSPIKRRLMMLTKNQNPKVNYISRLLVLPLAVVVFAAFSLKTKTVKSPLDPTEKAIVVVIDAGHGGTDKGGINFEKGGSEKNIALSLAKKIKELNNNKNVKIILTRETDIYQNPQEKAILANNLNPDLFISIHVDGAPKDRWDSASGMSVYVSKDNFANSGQSKLLASAIIEDFQKNYGLKVADLPHQREKGIWILQAVNHPSAIIEAGYMNNKIDYAYLTSDDGQEKFAQNVLNAINDFAASKDFVPTTEQTAPLNDTLGYYKGKAVIAMSVKAGASTARITYADNTTEVITLKQAHEAHLFPPPPLPPPPPPIAVPAMPPAPPTPPAPPALIHKDRSSAYYMELDPAGNYKGKAVISITAQRFGMVALGYPDHTYEKVSIPDARAAGLIIPKSFESVETSPGTKFSGYYKNKQVKGVNNYSDGRLVITYADNTTEIISNAEAKKIGLYSFPQGKQVTAILSDGTVISADTIFYKDKNGTNLFMAPGEAPAPATSGMFKNQIQSALNDKNVSAYQTAYLNTEAQNILNNKIKSHIVQEGAILPLRGNVLAVRNGIPIDSKNIKLDQGDNVKLLKGRDAYAKYGARASDGAIEITTTAPGPDPVFRVANINKARVPAVEFTNQKWLTVTDGYQIHSVVIFFSGAGFPQPAIMQLKGPDFTAAKAQLDKCVAGSAVTFTDIMVENKNGLRTIEERSYLLY